LSSQSVLLIVSFTAWGSVMGYHCPTYLSCYVVSLYISNELGWTL